MKVFRDFSGIGPSGISAQGYPLLDPLSFDVPDPDGRGYGYGLQKTEAEMLRTPNFGRKSLNEIKEVLTSMGLHLGMDIPDWPPDNIEELAKKFEDQF